MTALDEPQFRHFLEEGYLRLQGAIPTPLLQRLRDLFEELMQEGGCPENLILRNEVNGIAYVTNIDKPCSQGNLAVLETLGLPFILELARAICGEEFFCIQDFAVVKTLGENSHVGWHQDMLHGRTGRCFGMGVYLDSAGPGDGALQVVPRSHTSGRGICELQREPYVEVPMEAGDILIHDMMLAHASGPLSARPLRRVLYLIFLGAEQVRRENLYPEEYITCRTRVLDLAIRYYRQQHPDEALFEWNHPAASTFAAPENLRQELHALCSMNLRPRPSTYCFEMNGWGR